MVKLSMYSCRPGEMVVLLNASSGDCYGTTVASPER